MSPEKKLGSKTFTMRAIVTEDRQIHAWLHRTASQTDGNEDLDICRENIHAIGNEEDIWAAGERAGEAQINITFTVDFDDVFSRMDVNAIVENLTKPQ